MDYRKSERLQKKLRVKAESPKRQESSKSKSSTMKDKSKSRTMKMKSKGIHNHKGLNGQIKARVVKRSMAKKRRSTRSKLNSLRNDKSAKTSRPQTERAVKNGINEFYPFTNPVSHSTAFIQKLRLDKEMNFFRTPSSSCSNLSSYRNHSPFDNENSEKNTNAQIQTHAESDDRESLIISKMHNKKSKQVSKYKRKKLCPSIFIIPALE